MKKMEILKQKKGITLIALVVTIIVLLILAGVSISTIVGENGVLTKAKAAKEKTELAEEKEKVKLAVGASILNKEGMVEEISLRNGLNDYFGKDNYILTGGKDANHYVITMTESGKKYKIDLNGNLIESESNEEDDSDEIDANEIKIVPTGYTASGNVVNIVLDERASYSNMVCDMIGAIELKAYNENGTLLSNKNLVWEVIEGTVNNYSQTSGSASFELILGGRYVIRAFKSTTPEIYGELIINVEVPAPSRITLEDYGEGAYEFGYEVFDVGFSCTLLVFDEVRNHLLHGVDYDYYYSGENVADVTVLDTGNLFVKSKAAGTVEIVVTLKENPSISDTVSITFE